VDTDTGLAQRLFDRLRDATGDGVGISRESYGAGESLALDMQRTRKAWPPNATPAPT
jgi:hypothetical protein